MRTARFAPHARPTRGLSVLSVILLACGEPPPAPDPLPPTEAGVVSVAIDARDLRLLEGTTGALIVVARDSAGRVVEPVEVEWSAYPPDIVTVSPQGIVQGRGLGTGLVAANVGAASDTVPVDVRVRVAAVSAGAAHTCGITTEGSMYCWGGNREGRLGTGSRDPVTTPTRAASYAAFTQVSAGWELTCGLSGRGPACWGSNRSGQLGSADKADALQPVPLADDPSLIVIATLTTHSCGISARGHEAWCWGAGWAGQRGVGTSDGARPEPVSGALRFRALDVGWLFTCGVTTDGQAYCWGTNHWLQLGRADTLAMCDWPNGPARPCATEPAAVAATQVFDTIAVGTSHACALASGGTAYCWGRNDAGQLGTGATEGVALPQAVAASVAFTMVSAGDRHTCALDADGGAWCWGDNTSGALGTGVVGETCGDAPCARAPVVVATTLRFRSISASRGEGGVHTCGIATDGFAYCWGSNERGQLGTGEIDAGGPVPRKMAGQFE